MTDPDRLSGSLAVPSWRGSGPWLVTGGVGFLGQVVVRQLLASGCPEVRVADLEPAAFPDSLVKHHRLDLRDADLKAAFRGVETVLHLAACQYHSPFARSTYDLPFDSVNVLGTRRVVEAALSAGARRLVFVSTNMVYGPADRLPVRSDHPRRPIGPYAHSKARAEDWVERARAGGLDTVIIRPGLLVGPGRAGVMARIFDWVLAERPVFLIGNGENRYELIAVEDCARLLVLAGAASGSGEYNCGARGVPAMRDWIELVIAAAGSRSRVLPVPSVPLKLALRALERVRLAPLRADQYEIADRDYYLDTTATRRDFGWEPRWTGADAALDTFHWYVGQSRADHPRRLSLGAGRHP